MATTNYLCRASTALDTEAGWRARGLGVQLGPVVPAQGRAGGRRVQRGRRGRRGRVAGECPAPRRHLSVAPNRVQPAVPRDARDVAPPVRRVVEKCCLDAALDSIRPRMTPSTVAQSSMI